ncbi:MAG: PTS sugar transporter subunit IIA [Magnetococcales bacterium]|nr:PTS sugar transporter subunit IIA [Magnetococcales bacterium]
MSLFLKETRVIQELGRTDKAGLLTQLAEVLATDLSGVKPKRILDLLWERENIGSTAVGQGIAIPHGRLPGLSAPVAALARSRQGVDFRSMDGEPVHLIMALLLPSEVSEAHMQLLATISRLLRHPNSRRRLMQAPDRSSLYQATLTAAGDL